MEVRRIADREVGKVRIEADVAEAVSPGRIVEGADEIPDDVPRRRDGNGEVHVRRLDRLHERGGRPRIGEARVLQHVHHGVRDRKGLLDRFDIRHGDFRNAASLR